MIIMLAFKSKVVKVFGQMDVYKNRTYIVYTHCGFFIFNSQFYFESFDDIVQNMSSSHYHQKGEKSLDFGSKKTLKTWITFHQKCIHFNGTVSKQV